MATLRLTDLWGWLVPGERGEDRVASAASSSKVAKEAFEFSRRVYKETRGPTPALRLVYQAFLENKNHGESGGSTKAGANT